MSSVARFGPAVLRPLASIGDQMLLSALNLGLALVLIRTTDPASYGLYLQWFAVVLLVYSLVDASLGASLVSGYNHLSNQAARVSLISGYVRKTLLAVVVASCTSGLAWWAYIAPQGAGTSSAPPAWVGLAAVAFNGTYAWREFKRSTGHLLQKPFSVLGMDLSFGLGLALGIGGLWVTQRMELGAVLGVLALSALAATGLWIKLPFRLPAGQTRTLVRWRSVWDTSAWAIGGASLAWVSNHAFLYVSAALLGLAATAQVGAARLFVMPLSLITLGWKNTARADIGDLIHARNSAGVKRYLWRSVGMITGFGSAYLVVLWAVYGWLSAHLLPDAYQGLGVLIVAWSVYALVYNVRNVGSVLLAAMGHFKPLFKLDVTSLVVQAVAMPVVVPHAGAWGLIAVLALSEAVLLWWVWLRLVPDLLLKEAVA